jgi:hypothetical protein
MEATYKCNCLSEPVSLASEYSSSTALTKTRLNGAGTMNKNKKK